MASFSAGTTFTDGVANDVTAAKLAALVNNATPTSGLIQDRTAETVTATNDTLLIGDASDSNNLKRITVANFAQTLPTAKVTTGTINTATLGTTTGTAATFTTGTITTLTAGTTTSTAATITTGTIPTLVATTLVTTGTGTAASPAIVPTGDTNTGIFFPAADTIAFSDGGAERLRISSIGNVGIGVTTVNYLLHLLGDGAAKASTSTWTVHSDSRLKTNIVDADKDRCYEIVKEIPLKRYTWKNEVYSQDQVRDRSKLGWIAQDVEAVFPKAVGTNKFTYNQVFEEIVTPEVDFNGNPVLDENGNPKTKTEKRLVSEEVIEDCKDLNSDQIYAVMYGTIQKLIEKVEVLEAKVAALEAA